VVKIHCQGKIFSQIRAVIFDKDGTLADSRVFWRELAISRAKIISRSFPEIPELEFSLLSAFGVKDDAKGTLRARLDPAGLMAVGSRLENEIGAAACVAAAGKSWFEARNIVAKAFQEADKEKDSLSIAPLFEGVTSLLQSLSQKGLKLGILSADTTAGVENFVKYHRLGSYIRWQMGSDRIYSKPDPALFLEACRQLAVQPSQAIMVGDAQGDIDMARSSGAAGTIAICWNDCDWGKIIGADAVVDRLEAIDLI
jgi:phosphoglycolate phosphatase